MAKKPVETEEVKTTARPVHCVFDSEMDLIGTYVNEQEALSYAKEEVEGADCEVFVYACTPVYRLKPSQVIIEKL